LFAPDGAMKYSWEGPNNFTSTDQNPSVPNATVKASGDYIVTIDGVAQDPITVTVNPLPSAFAVNGGGSYCTGGSGVAVGLADSESGVSYQLKRNGSDVGSAVSGTGSGISFGNQTAAGNYTVQAISGAGCNATMTGSVDVMV